MSKIEVNTIEPQSGTTVTVGASGNTITIPSGVTLNGSNATLTGIASTNGITMADQWRWTAAFTGTTSVTSNWERNDTNFDKIGTGMTESSGIFTFPSTGIYHVSTGTSFNLNSNSRYNGIMIELSTNGGSSFTDVAEGYAHISNNTSSATYANAHANAMIDVTNTSNFKIRIRVSHHDANTSSMGSSSLNNNYTNFIRLGDT